MNLGSFTVFGVALSSSVHCWSYVAIKLIKSNKNYIAKFHIFSSRRWLVATLLHSISIELHLLQKALLDSTVQRI